MREVGGYIGVPEGWLYAGALLFDDVGDEGRVMLGYEDVASVEIGVI